MLIFYSLLIFLIALGDALMAYTAPIYLESKLAGPALMGLVIAASSAAGLALDFFLNRLFCRQSYRFSLLLALLVALAFPLVYLAFPPWLGVLVLGMVLWGAYYELISYSNFDFVHRYAGREKYASSWGVISVFKSAAYFLGPILAGVLLDRFLALPFVAASVLFVLGLGVYLVFIKAGQSGNRRFSRVDRVQRPLWLELKAMRLLFSRIWPLWLFVLSLFWVDATFWTVGTLLSEELKDLHPFGGLLLSLYILPSLFIGLLAAKAARPWGKKRIAFLAGFFAGLVLLAAGRVGDTRGLLLLVFVSACLGALSVPEMMATFEDYMARLGDLKGEVISLERTAENVAYITGPILAGLTAVFLGYRLTLGAAGGVLMLVSLLALLVVPRKIKLPQHQLHQEAS